MVARSLGCGKLNDATLAGLRQNSLLTEVLRTGRYDADDRVYDAVEQNTFTLAPKIGACPEHLGEYIATVKAIRSAVKKQSESWDMNSRPVRDRLYRLLYGSRAAIEEVMLQAPPALVPETLLCDDEPSHTPSANILGVTIHSGDILVSRGGVAASALIARGSDYPGNFSHVALVRVDSAGNAFTIESHIEKGVAVASVDEYLHDKKLRVMVLRLRSDLSPLTDDPMLPGRVASRAFSEAQTRHIPYDFGMDVIDTSRFFCSEVVSNAYQKAGISLWTGTSTISSPGTSRWLSMFGVEHFETEEPSDLEYDPQLRVVAEWRNPEVLFQDHVDNAVIDVMLEGAERGDGLEYAWYLLPVARATKAYSVVVNLFGGVGPIPEGMSAAAALRVKAFTARHERIRARVLEGAREFQRARGYVPPYWELLKLARAS